jgi:hypothetical protein
LLCLQGDRIWLQLHNGFLKEPKNSKTGFTSFSGKHKLFLQASSYFCEHSRRGRKISHRRKCKISLSGKGLRGRCLSVLGPETHTTSPLTRCTLVYSILIHAGRGEGEKVEPERRVRSNSSQSWVKNTNMTDCISSL